MRARHKTDRHTDGQAETDTSRNTQKKAGTNGHTDR